MSQLDMVSLLLPRERNLSLVILESNRRPSMVVMSAWNTLMSFYFSTKTDLKVFVGCVHTPSFPTPATHNQAVDFAL